MSRSPLKINLSKIYKFTAKPKKYKSSALHPSLSSSISMTSIANTTSNSFLPFSRKMIPGKIVKRIGLIVLSVKCRTIWLGRTQRSRKKSMFSANLWIAVHTTQKIAISGFSNLLDSTEVEASRSLTLFSSFRESCFSTWQWWTARKWKTEEIKTRN